MPDACQTLADRVQERFAGIIERCTVANAEVTAEVPRGELLGVCRALRDEPGFAFEILIDLCGVDYLAYGQENGQEYDRVPGREQGGHPREGARFAVVYHLLSVRNNQRLRLRTFLDDEQPRVDSVIDVWASADWYEREAFDLFGILFDGHPDLRRLLTDYGFIGHPFRKDFPLSGNVEMRYDPEKRRVVYEPVSIEPRINVPRVIRHDHRYLVGTVGEGTGNG